MVNETPHLLLCFGDSNTWGFDPRGGRYPAALCWPQQLAQRLNRPLQVEGKPGRTLWFARPESGLTAGYEDWQRCLRAQPADLVLALGINDLAAGATPQQCQQALERYLQAWQTVAPSSALTLIAPAPLGRLTSGWLTLFAGQQQASQELGELWLDIAREWRLPCYQTDNHFCPGEDGLHWNAEFHTHLALKLATMLTPPR